MSDLKVAIIQTHLYWENIEDNLNHFESKLSAIESADIIVLPETFSTGFSMKPELYAQESKDKTTSWLLHWAKTKNAAIAGSVMLVDQGKYYNQLLFVEPDGTIHRYNKRHLFTMGEENKHYSAGNEKVIVQYKGFKICLQICYDLRFPVFVRNKEKYDVILYVANWPAVRDYIWRNLLISRAIENQCYVIACNRIGEDGNQVNHIGNSGWINYLGQEHFTTNEDCVIELTLNTNELMSFRNQFPVLNDMDEF